MKLWLLIAGCGGGTEAKIGLQDTADPSTVAAQDTAAPQDTGEPPPTLAQGVAFYSAELRPPFAHGNAAWAGVALLDYDQDGWLDIYFTNGESNPNALYRNLGNGAFEDVAAAAGVDLMSRTGQVAAGDIDNDGDPDMVVGIECSLGTLSEDGSSLGDGGIFVLLNAGDGRFESSRLSLPSEIAARGMCPVSLALVDYNNDGWLDLSASNGIDPDQVYPWKFGLTAPEANDFLLLGDGMGGFSNPISIVTPTHTEISVPDIGDRCALGCATTTFVSSYLDLNDDGRLDRISGEGGRSLLVYLQDEAGVLRYQPEATISGVGQWMGLALADFDGDADLDIYATNQGISPLILGYDNIPPVVDPVWVNPFHSLFQQNAAGIFVEHYDWPTLAEHALAADDYRTFYDPAVGEEVHGQWFPLENLQRYSWGWAAVALDVDADGWTDVAFNGNNCSAPMSIVWDESKGAGPGGLLRNAAGTGFVDITFDYEIPNTDELGRYQDGRGLAVGDLNNDGYPDLVYANRSYNPTQYDPLAQEPGVPKVWLSKPRDGHWLRIDLVGTRSNKDAIGALVDVDLGAHHVLSVLGGSGATNSSSERTVLVGTGNVSTVDVVVTFPSGQVVRKTAVAVDQRITVEEP
jgi:hypothetical protein